jgi:hypothetical protein
MQAIEICKILPWLQLTKRRSSWWVGWWTARSSWINLVKSEFGQIRWICARTRRLKWNEGYWPPGLGRPGTLIFWDISRDMGGIQESWDIIASIPYVPWSKLWYMVFGLPSRNWRPLRAYNFLWYNELMIVPFMDQKPCVDHGMWFFRHVVFLEWRCQTVLENKWWSLFSNEFISIPTNVLTSDYLEAWGNLMYPLVI